MDTALPQKFPFILDRNLAKANCTGNRVCASCDTVVLVTDLKIQFSHKLNELSKSLMVLFIEFNKGKIHPYSSYSKSIYTKHVKGSNNTSILCNFVLKLRTKMKLQSDIMAMHELEEKPKIGAVYRCYNSLYKFSFVMEYTFNFVKVLKKWRLDMLILIIIL